MNKLVKRTLITSLVITIIGIVFVGIGVLNKNNFRLNIRKTGIEIINQEKNSTPVTVTEEFEKIDINLGYANVAIEQGIEYKIEVICYTDSYVPEYYIEENIMKVSDYSEEEGVFNYLNPDLSFEFEMNQVIVTVPEDINMEEVNVNIVCGKIEVDEDVSDNIVLNNKIGKIVLHSDKDNSNLDVNIGLGYLDLFGERRYKDQEIFDSQLEKSISANIGFGNIVIKD